MGHTNQTANYNLPQFVGTDKPSWLGDINDAFAAIDTAISAAASEASTADGKADALGITVSGHTTQIGTLQNTVTTQGNTLNTVTSLIGNGTPTTTDHTIIGAINELHANQGDLTSLTTTDKSSLVAAINEVAGGGGGSEYDEVSVSASNTWKQALELLHAETDFTKVKGGSTLVFIPTDTTKQTRVCNIASYNVASSTARFERAYMGSGHTTYYCEDYKLESTGEFTDIALTNGSTTLSDKSSSLITEGVLRINY